jgi:hypothetical protein
MCYASFFFLFLFSLVTFQLSLFLFIFHLFFQLHLIRSTQIFRLKELSFSCGAVEINGATSVHQSLLQGCLVITALMPHKVDKWTGLQAFFMVLSFSGTSYGFVGAI